MAERTSEPTPATDGGPKRVTPAFFSRDDGTGLPTIDASKPYILAHHPNRWMVMDGRLVPSPSAFRLVDGCNRVRVAPDGRVHFADAQAKLQDAGFRLIPYEHGPGGESYLQEVDTRPDGRSAVVKATISVWETAHAGDSNTELDEKAYADWLEELVKTNRIAACQPHVARRMLASAQASLADAEEKKAAGKLTDHGRIDALKLEIQVLSKAAGKGDKVKGTKSAPDLGVKA
jgi:hypothetical protein